MESCWHWDQNRESGSGTPEVGLSVRAFSHDTKSTRDIAISPDGWLLACVKEDDGVGLVFEIETRTLRFAASSGSEPNGGFACVAFSPDSQTIAFGTDRGEVQLVDATSGAKQGTLHLSDSDSGIIDPVGCVSFLPDGSTLAASTGGSLKLWDVTAAPSATASQTLSSAQFEGRATLSPDGQFAAYALRTGDWA